MILATRIPGLTERMRQGTQHGAASPEPVSTQQLIEQLERRGYRVTRPASDE
jgi:hypothetical protein